METTAPRTQYAADIIATMAETMATASLVACYRTTDVEMEEFLAGRNTDHTAHETLTRARGWLLDAMEMQHPGTIAAWSDALDEGQEIDVIDMFEAFA